MHSFNELVPIFENRFSEHVPFNQAPLSLYEPCRYFLDLGGKRIRPVLCLMGNELFGPITDDAWNAAMAIELFHNFTLIHDDMMDKAPLRRGKQTLHTRNGMTAGILCGDVMSIYAYQQLARIEFALPGILHLFNETAIAVCEGQQLDMDFEGMDSVDIEDYIRMISQKTSVLLACSLKMGALLGGATEGNASKLYEFGKNLGIAFQLQDDYLDAYGNSEKTGKQQGGDILSNKKTFLLLKALENASDAQRQEIKNCLGKSGEEKVREMLRLFSETGADEDGLKAVKKYSDTAFDCLEDVAVVSKRKKELKALAAFLLRREM